MQFVPTFSLYVSALFVLTGASVGVRVLPLSLHRLLPKSKIYVAALFVLTGAPAGVCVLPLRLHRGGQLLCAGRHTTFRQRP